MQHYLDYISIKGFRSIWEIQKLKLRPINILIGANGSGKSNFVEVFSFLNAIRRGKLRNYTAQRGGADTILHFGSKVTPEIEIEISFNSQVNGGYQILLGSTDIDELYIKDEGCWFLGKQYWILNAVNGEAGISQPGPRITSWVQSCLDRLRIYHFHDTSKQSPMKRLADVNDNYFLRSDGIRQLPGSEGTGQQYRSQFPRFAKFPKCDLILALYRQQLFPLYWVLRCQVNLIIPGSVRGAWNCSIAPGTCILLGAERPAQPRSFSLSSSLSVTASA
ncbi:MAG: AAA family ATPase [Hormoscilla sp. GM102CHS1]|nr:AAA family ATPase [Hormoscilla sp. GM102CHS1]